MGSQLVKERGLVGTKEVTHPGWQGTKSGNAGHVWTIARSLSRWSVMSTGSPKGNEVETRKLQAPRPRLPPDLLVPGRGPHAAV